MNISAKIIEINFRKKREKKKEDNFHSKFNFNVPLHIPSSIPWLPASALEPAKAVNTNTAQRMDSDVIMKVKWSGIIIMQQYE